MTEQVQLPAFRAQVNAQFAEAVERHKIQRQAFSEGNEAKAQLLDAKRTTLKARVAKIIEGLSESEIDNWITKLDSASGIKKDMHAVLVLGWCKK